jgi:hypothetical protein
MWAENIDGNHGNRIIDTDKEQILLKLVLEGEIAAKNKKWRIWKAKSEDLLVVKLAE